MPRMKNKSREDGRVQSKVYLGNGKYKYVYASNNRELEQKVQEVKTRLGKGIDVSADRDTFGYWRDNWLKIKKSGASAKWYETCVIYAGKLEELSALPITKIKAIDLQNILLSMSTEKNSSGKP